jgi:hypothetical protein
VSRRPDPAQLGRRRRDRGWTALLAATAAASFALAIGLQPRAQPAPRPVTGVVATLSARGTVLDPEPAQLLEVTVVDAGPEPVRVTAVTVDRLAGPPAAVGKGATDEVDVVLGPQDTARIPARAVLDCRDGGIVPAVSLRVEAVEATADRRATTVAAVNTGGSLVRSGCLSALQQLPAGSLSTTVTGRLVRADRDGGRITAGGLPPGRVRSLRAGAWGLVLTEPAVIGLLGDLDLQFALPGHPCLLPTDQWSTLPTGVTLTYERGQQAYVIVGTGLARILLDGYRVACGG